MAETKQINPISKALIELQAELSPVHKNALNPFFKKNYADLPNVIEMLRPLLHKHRLVVLQLPTLVDGEQALKTVIQHESGESVESVLKLVVDKENDAQRQGAAITYARRYSLVSALGIVTDDDEPYLASGSSKAALGLKNPSATPYARPSAAQLDRIQKAAEHLGYEQEMIDARMKQIKTSREADDAYATLEQIRKETES